MVRILVTVSPQMYREAIALAVQRRCPGVEVRMAPPEAAEEELAGFQPHLLVHSDEEVFGAEELARIPFRVEILYSDSMNARVHANGRVEELRGAALDHLFAAVDEAAAWAPAEKRA